MIKIKRAYERMEKTDGVRILVDRLWPRGLSKEKAHLDYWMKEIAPSNDLRKWFHQTGEWQEFVKRYHRELKEHKDLVEQLAELADKRNVTLIYASKDNEQNNAVVLASYITKYNKN